MDIAILGNFDVSFLDSVEEHEKIGHNIKMIKAYKSQQHLHPSVGLFANILDELFANLGPKLLDEILESSIKNVSDQFKVDDYIFKRNKLKTGLDGSAKIYFGSNTSSIESYSTISVELTDNQSIFPPYYIYLYSQSEQIPEGEYKKALGKEIAKHIEQFFNKLKGDKSDDVRE